MFQLLDSLMTKLMTKLIIQDSIFCRKVPSITVKGLITEE